MWILGPCLVAAMHVHAAGQGKDGGSTNMVVSTEEEEGFGGQAHYVAIGSGANQDPVPETSKTAGPTTPVISATVASSHEAVIRQLSATYEKLVDLEKTVLNQPSQTVAQAQPAPPQPAQAQAQAQPAQGQPAQTPAQQVAPPVAAATPNEQDVLGVLGQLEQKVHRLDDRLHGRGTPASPSPSQGLEAHQDSQATTVNAPVATTNVAAAAASRTASAGPVQPSKAQKPAQTHAGVMDEVALDTRPDEAKMTSFIIVIASGVIIVMLQLSYIYVFFYGISTPKFGKKKVPDVNSTYGARSSDPQGARLTAGDAGGG